MSGSATVNGVGLTLTHMSAVTAAAADDTDEVTNPPSSATPEHKEEIHAEVGIPMLGRVSMLTVTRILDALRS